MRLREALEIIRQTPEGSAPFRLLLACGFTPLYFQTFVQASVQQALPERRVEVGSGLYGDLIGTLRRITEMSESWHAVAVVVEWSDLDPRLGYRSLGGWGIAQQRDMVNVVNQSLANIRAAIVAAAEKSPVTLCLPTLGLPPVFHTTSWQCGEAAAAIRAAVADFAAHLAATCRIVNEQKLAEISPPGERMDLRSELRVGLPYTMDHASKTASALANLIAPAPPKKGLIVDLDDTLWSGIVGEVGPKGVLWDLSSHTQLHALLQQTVSALAGQGVLVAVASKNDSAVAMEALRRDDFLIPNDQIFPIEIHWGAKSGSVERILKAWNIGADAVVFVDDSPLELAEVGATFPQVECLLFPKDDESQALALLEHLRDRFGKPRLNEEDLLRRESLVKAARFGEMSAETAPDEFLASLEATVTLDLTAADNERVFELINKTNQFNLNGERYDTVSWEQAAARPGAFAWSVAYHDKFGPLGKIAAISGFKKDNVVHVDTWVMSCRAFARRIEYQVLKQLLAWAPDADLEFQFRATERNGPVQELLSKFCESLPTAGTVKVTPAAFQAACPPLFHSVRIAAES